jgi:hypothetical protein
MTFAKLFAKLFLFRENISNVIVLEKISTYSHFWGNRKSTFRFFISSVNVNLFYFYVTKLKCSLAHFLIYSFLFRHVPFSLLSTTTLCMYINDPPSSNFRLFTPLPSNPPPPPNTPPFCSCCLLGGVGGNLNLCTSCMAKSKGKIFRARICKRLWSPVIDYEESIPPAYVAWMAGTANRVVVPVRQVGN